jgi:hypothetical protein
LLFKFPEDGLGTTENAVVVQAQASHLDDFFDVPSRVVRAAEGASGSIQIPAGIVRGIASQPLVEPRFRATKRESNLCWVSGFPILFNGPLAFLFDRFFS